MADVRDTRLDLDSPSCRIAAATGEEDSVVRHALHRLGLLGYSADDIWTLVGGALDAGMTVSALADQLGPKA